MKHFLRSLCTLLMLVVWASGFAADIVANFTNGNIPTGWTKNGTTQNHADYGTQLQTNASVTSPAFTEIIKTITINLTRSSNGTNFTVGYIKNGQTTVFKTFKSGDVTVRSLKDYKIEVPIEAQISGVKFVFTSINASYYVKTITFSSGVNKTATRLIFPQPAINIVEGNEASFTGQTATLKAGETVLNKTITYAKSGDEIFATFDATTGDATLKTGVYGTATVTATYAGDETYEKAVASYTVKIVDPNAIVPLVFDKADDVFGTLESYNKDKEDISEYALIGSDGNSYTFKTTGGKTAAKNGNLQLQNTTGSLESPIFKNFENGYTVNITFSQKGTTPLTITSGGETKKADITSANGKNTNGIGFLLSMNIKAGNTFTLNAGNAAYISKIEIVAIPGVTLDEAADDTDTKIANNNGKTVDVTLTRTLTANVWNTICLPFDVTEEQIANVLKSKGNVKEFDREDANTPTIYFKDATTMTAGKPYLIKPTVAATELLFKGVTIKNVDALDRMVGDKYNMCGVFGKYEMKTNGTELFLTTQGKFAVPAPTTNVMRGFRAYFFVPKSTAGAALNLSFGEATGIDGVAADAEKNVKVYNVNGQYVGTNLDALPKGLYIVGGKKVLK